MLRGAPGVAPRPADGRAVGLAVHLGRGCDARDGGKRRNGAPHVEYKHGFAEDIWDAPIGNKGIPNEWFDKFSVRVVVKSDRPSWIA